MVIEIVPAIVKFPQNILFFKEGLNGFPSNSYIIISNNAINQTITESTQANPSIPFSSFRIIATSPTPERIIIRCPYFLADSLEIFSEGKGLSGWLIRSTSISNKSLIENQLAIKAAIQKECNAKEIYNSVVYFLKNPELMEKQIKDCEKTLTQIRSKTSSSDAASSVLAKFLVS